MRTASLLRLSDELIRMHPPEFREEFSDEMCSTLAALLEESAHRGRLAHIAKWLTEMLALVGSIMREHRRAAHKREDKMKPVQWSWQKALIVLLPVILWLGMLRLSNSSIFHNTWVVYQQAGGSLISRDALMAGLSPLGKLMVVLQTMGAFAPYTALVVLGFVALGILLIALGWREERRFPVSGLPSLGMMTYFALLVLGNLLELPTSMKNTLSGPVPLVLLMIWLVWTQWAKRWALPKGTWTAFLAIPVVALVSVLAGYLFDVTVYSGGAIARQASGALMASGPATLALLLGLLFAPRYGVRAALFAVGFLCFALMTPLQGLEANGASMATGGVMSFLTFQAVESALFVAAFFLATPALFLFAGSASMRRIGLLLPLALVYGILIAVQGYEEGWTGHQLLLAGNLVQVLIALVLALRLYEWITPGAQPEAAGGEAGALMPV